VLLVYKSTGYMKVVQIGYTTRSVQFIALQPKAMEYHMSMEIRDLAKEAVIIGEHETFHSAISLMVQKQTNSLLVVDEEGHLTGEVGMSDLLNAIVPEDMDPEDMLKKLNTEEGFAHAIKNATGKEVCEFMTVDIQPIHVDDSLLSIASTAIAYGTQHIPIVDYDNRPIGVISRRGLKHILAKHLDIPDSA
jgi:CBS domain-containing protein